VPGLNRRQFGRAAALLAAGAALPFYNELALAQDLKEIASVPPDAVRLNTNENPMGPCLAALEAIRKVVPLGGRYLFDQTHAYVEALAAQRRGTRHREESRRRMSEAHRRRGTLVPGTVVWTKAEDRLVRSLPAAEAARRTGRTLVAVWQRRRVLGVPDGRRKGNRRH
jgi:hypothetical protein